MSAPPTVLVVEDNALNLKLIRDVLEHAGFTVLVATSGEEGVDLAARGGLDLVLMDLQLPGITMSSRTRSTSSSASVAKASGPEPAVRTS